MKSCSEHDKGIQITDITRRSLATCEISSSWINSFSTWLNSYGTWTWPELKLGLRSYFAMIDFTKFIYIMNITTFRAGQLPPPHKDYDLEISEFFFFRLLSHRNSLVCAVFCRPLDFATIIALKKKNREKRVKDLWLGSSRCRRTSQKSCFSSSRKCTQVWNSRRRYNSGYLMAQELQKLHSPSNFLSRHFHITMHSRSLSRRYLNNNTYLSISNRE